MNQQKRPICQKVDLTIRQSLELSSSFNSTKDLPVKRKTRQASPLNCPITPSAFVSHVHSDKISRKKQVSASNRVHSISDWTESLERLHFLFKIAEAVRNIKRRILQGTHTLGNRTAQEKQRASKGDTNHPTGAKEGTCAGPSQCKKLKTTQERTAQRKSDPQAAKAHQLAMMRILDEEYGLSMEDWVRLKALMSLRDELAHPKVPSTEIRDLVDKWRQMDPWRE